ncbi:hypothetical protein AMTRI_Chr02g222240 [Amborella trichopoda]
MDPTNNENQLKNIVFLFEASCDLQPIILFAILNCLIGPSHYDFRISLLNGMFSSVEIGGSIPSLRTVIEGSTLLAFRLNLLYLTE